MVEFDGALKKFLLFFENGPIIVHHANLIAQIGEEATLPFFFVIIDTSMLCQILQKMQAN